MAGKRYVVGVAVLVAVAVLFNLPPSPAARVKAEVRDSLAPFQNLFTAVERQLRGMAWYVAGAWQAPGTERDLRFQIATLRQELWRLRELESENRHLRQLAGFKQQHPERLLVAEVTARGDTSGWWHTVRLNRGTADGVALDQPVLTAEGLVGRTIAVSAHTCEVLLLSDPGFQVSCRVGRDAAFGILRGRGVSPGGEARLAMFYGAPPADLQYLSTTTTVAEGDLVVTSGLGGVYPSGIPVGRVSGVRLDPSQLYMTATVQPTADLGSLYYVFILIKRDVAS